MKIFYSDKPLNLRLDLHSIFLAGPTPRSKSIKSWRPKAIEILKSLGYNGQVIVPETEFQSKNFDYIKQCEWENSGLKDCSVIVFWIPRNLKTMPAFTTNVEFGRFVRSNRTLYGRPDDAPKNRYLDWLYKKFNGNDISNNLKDLLTKAINK
jgi:hypothetical protein